jgi:hypothetical protein
VINSPLSMRCPRVPPDSMLGYVVNVRTRVRVPAVDAALPEHEQVVTGRQPMELSITPRVTTLARRCCRGGSDQCCLATSALSLAGLRIKGLSAHIFIESARKVVDF